jgi:hypothetical protein
MNITVYLATLIVGTHDCLNSRELGLPYKPLKCNIMLHVGQNEAACIQTFGFALYKNSLK